MLDFKAVPDTVFPIQIKYKLIFLTSLLLNIVRHRFLILTIHVVTLYFASTCIYKIYFNFKLLVYFGFFCAILVSLTITSNHLFSSFHQYFDLFLLKNVINEDHISFSYNINDFVVPSIFDLYFLYL